ncbi:MAG: 2-C-methyl-D-erythritol 4-phosphate cytidylyltransferase [Chthoniobacterales bacterium]
MLTAIIVAGGSSQRMGFDKILAPLAGKSVLAHSLEAFEQTASVERIILVGQAEKLAQYEKISEAFGFKKIAAVIPGGTRRQDSVQCGLEQVDASSTFVAVHDAARPLVRPDLIERIFAAAQTHGGATSAAPVIDTLKRADDQYMVTGGVERAGLFAVQTPQIFRRELLDKAYQAIFDAGLEVTDEISAIERVGGNVVLLPNEEPNFKITYPGDLSLAEFLLSQRGSRQISGAAAV